MAFTPNRMYQKNLYDFSAPTVAKRYRDKMNAALFRQMAGASYRNFYADRHWCGSNRYPGGKTGGRAYPFLNYRAYIWNMLELYQQLQFDATCLPEMKALQKMMVDVNPTEAVNANNPLETLNWWETTFLPLLVNAFACDATLEPADLVVHKGFLPHDIEQAFPKSAREPSGTGPGNRLVVKAWKLTKLYLISGDKQRALIERTDDFDLGLYVPFLDRYTDPDSTPWTKDARMRMGQPTYNGPAIWWSFHVIAQRYWDLSTVHQLTPQYKSMIMDLFKKMLTQFAISGQPCPLCREHFLSQVSQNDQQWKTKLDWTDSQARVFPQEWLYTAGPKQYEDGYWATPAAGTLPDKLLYLDPTHPETLQLFLSRLHNAVTSSVRLGWQCRTEERFGNTGLMKAQGSSQPTKCHGTTSTACQYTCGPKRCPQFHRAWPFLSRNQFWVEHPAGTKTWSRYREQLLDYTTTLASLDTAATRVKFWETSTDTTTLTTSLRESPAVVDKVKTIMATLKTFDKALLESGAFQSTYSPAAAGPFDNTRASQKAQGWEATVPVAFNDNALKESAAASVPGSGDPYTLPPTCVTQYHKYLEGYKMPVCEDLGSRRSGNDHYSGYPEHERISESCEAEN